VRIWARTNSLNISVRCIYFVKTSMYFCFIKFGELLDKVHDCKLLKDRPQDHEAIHGFKYILISVEQQAGRPDFDSRQR
jgi:hypothetical protein